MLSILNFFLVLYKNGLGGFPFASPSPVGGRKEVDMNYDFYYVLIVTLVLLLIAKPR